MTNEIPLAYFDNHWLEQLKANAPIESIIAEYLPLKPRGGRFVGLCPFHQDSSPSLYITPHLGIYKCFACGAGGDVLKFLCEFEKIEFNDAVKILAEKTGTPLPKSSHDKEKSSQQRDARDTFFDAHEKAELFYREHLWKSEEALQYFRDRGLSDETLKTFGLGYAPEGWSNLVEHLLPKGYSKPDLIQAGLLGENDKGRTYDRFRHRYIFPIRNSMGKTVGFGGRAIDPDEKAKYLNSPESPLYQKSQILYGFDRARRAAAERRELIIVEGYFDVIQLHQAGITHTVAVSGTALTKEHAELIHRYVDRVYLFFDGDAAGEKAIERSLAHLLPYPIEIKTYLFPAGEDPDSIALHKGAAGIEKLLNESMNWVDFRLRSLNEQSSPDTKARIAELLKKDLELIVDPIRRETWTQEIAQKLNLTLQHFTTKSSFSRRPSFPLNSTPKELKGPEARLASLLIHHPKILTFAHQHFDLNLIKNATLAGLIDQAFEFLERQGEFELKAFYNSQNAYWQNWIESQVDEVFGAEEDLIREYMQSVCRFELNRLEEFWTRCKNISHTDKGFQLWQQLKPYVSQMRQIKEKLFAADGREAQAYTQYLQIAHEIRDLLLQVP